MKSKHLFYLLFTATFIACTNTTTNHCKCYNSIETSEVDTPVFTFSFSNQKAISVCGYKETKNKKDIFSEFNIFDCTTGKSLLQYEALDKCYINTKKDTVIIQRLDYLPNPTKKWEWDYIQIGEQKLIVNDSIKVLAETPKFNPFTISPKEQTEFLNSLLKKKGLNNESETDLGKLQILAMCGNDKAWKILQNYEDIMGQKTDGSTKEQLLKALSIIKWIRTK